jgi:FAD/FMN-containing dehydrogenase
MLIGSAGSLGIVAEVTLRTFARPADERSIFFFCRNAAHAEDLLAAILTAPVTPAYVQLIGTRTFAGNPLQLPAPEGGGPVLVTGFLGRPESCAAQIEIVRALPAAQGMESIAQTAAQSGRLRLWMTTEPELPPSAGNGGVGFRLHVPSSKTAGLLASLEAQVPAAWLVAEAQGVIRGTLPAPGALSILRQLAPDAPLLITQGSAPPAPPNPLVARLKNALDPQNLFGQMPV